MLETAKRSNEDLNPLESAAAHAKVREVKGKLPEGLDSDYQFVIYF